MILVVGHGQSSDVDPEWVDAQDFIVRILNTTIKQKPGEFQPHIGSKTDAVVSTQLKYMKGRDLPFWYEGEWRDTCRQAANPFTERKLSAGTVGCIIAHHLHPDEDIGVIGFDTTMRGIGMDNWPYHDAVGECRLLHSIGVEDFGNYG